MLLYKDFLQELLLITDEELGMLMTEAFENIKNNYSVDQLVRDEVDVKSIKVKNRKIITAALLALFTGATIMIPGSTIGIIGLAAVLNGGKKPNNIKVYSPQDMMKYNDLLDLVQRDPELMAIADQIKRELEQNKPNQNTLKTLSIKFKNTLMEKSQDGNMNSKEAIFNTGDRVISEASDIKKYREVEIIKDYSKGKWKKIFSAVADMGITSSSTIIGTAVFGLSVWGGPIGIGAVLAGLFALLSFGTSGAVLKILLNVADNTVRVNPKIKKLSELAKKDSKSTAIVNKIEAEMDSGKADKNKLRLLKNDLTARLKELERGDKSITESAFTILEEQVLLEDITSINEEAVLTEAFKLNFRAAKKDQFERFMYIKEKTKSDDKFKYIKLAAGTFSSNKLSQFINEVEATAKKNASIMSKLNDFQKLDLLIMLLDKAESNKDLKKLEEKTKNLYHKYVKRLNLDEKEPEIRVFTEKLPFRDSVIAFLIFASIVTVIPGIHLELAIAILAFPAVIGFLVNIPNAIGGIIDRIKNRSNPDKDYDIDSKEFNEKLERTKKKLSESVDFEKEYSAKDIFNKDFPVEPKKSFKINIGDTVKPLLIEKEK
jgi:hypothetical protein